jgi:hypothetical protein
VPKVPIINSSFKFNPGLLIWKTGNIPNGKVFGCALGSVISVDAYTMHLCPAQTIEWYMGRYHGITANIAEPTIDEQLLRWCPELFPRSLNHSIVSFDVVKFYTRHEHHIFEMNSSQ